MLQSDVLIRNAHIVDGTGNPWFHGDVALAGARIMAITLPGQLAPEHALDLEGRERVIFVDAGKGTLDPYELRRVEPKADFSYTSHAMSPEAVLATYARVTGTPPPESWVLCVRGESFELGEPLSAAAAEKMEVACRELSMPLGLRH